VVRAGERERERERERAIAKAYYGEKNLQLQIRYTVVSGN